MSISNSKNFPKNTPGLPLKGGGEGKGEEGREEKGREGGKGLATGICAVVNFPLKNPGQFIPI